MPFGYVAAAGSLASAGSSILGGIAGSHAAKGAANAESNALQSGINFQTGVYNTGQQNLQPWIGGGQSALQSLLGFYGLPGGNASGANQGFQQFQQTPFYQFPLQQGTLALNRQLAASGLIGSGAAMKEGAQYASGLASSGLQSYLGGLSGLAGAGQSASTSLLTGGNQAAASLGNLYGNQGAAQAGGIIGSNNALQQGYQGAIGSVLGGLTGGVQQPQSNSLSSYSGGSGLGGLIGNFFGGNSYGTGGPGWDTSSWR